MELHYRCSYCGADAEDGYHFSGQTQVPICEECAKAMYFAFMDAAVKDADMRVN